MRNKKVSSDPFGSPETLKTYLETGTRASTLDWPNTARRELDPDRAESNSALQKNRVNDSAQITCAWITQRDI
jgi:hypothetical protein